MGAQAESGRKVFRVPERVGQQQRPVTQDIQRVIDECARNGGGTVVLPRGTYQVSSLRLHSDIELRLLGGAHILGSTDWRDYKDFHVPTTIDYVHDEGVVRMWHLPDHYFNAIITAVGERNVSIVGEPGSMIDGRDCFDPNGEEGFRGPMGIVMSACENVTLSGYAFNRSANWSHQLDSCKNVLISHVDVEDGHDGFDIHHCENVRISDCTLRTGDDCVAGYDARNVVIERCLMQTACNGVRLGCVNLLVDKCRFDGRAPYPHKASGRRDMHYAIRYYSMAEDHIREDSDNWVVRDCDFETTGGLVFYHFGDQHSFQLNRPHGRMRFEGITARNLTRTSHFVGTQSKPGCIELEGCELGWAGTPEEPLFAFGEHADVRISNFASNHELSVRLPEEP